MKRPAVLYLLNLVCLLSLLITVSACCGLMEDAKPLGSSIYLSKHDLKKSIIHDYDSTDCSIGGLIIAEDIERYDFNNKYIILEIANDSTSKNISEFWIIDKTKIVDKGSSVKTYDFIMDSVIVINKSRSEFEFNMSELGLSEMIFIE
jgi:hypothetical protein